MSALYIVERKSLLSLSSSLSAPGVPGKKEIAGVVSFYRKLICNFSPKVVLEEEDEGDQG